MNVCFSFVLGYNSAKSKHLCNAMSLLRVGSTAGLNRLSNYNATACDDITCDQQRYS